MTQTELSEITGISRVYIVYIVGGRMLPDDKQLEKICQALKVTSDMIYPDPAIRELLAGDKPPTRRKSRAASALFDARREMRKHG
jgi:transcriptional regulator with XRE-family HTH domain